MNLRTQIRRACFLSLLSVSLFVAGCNSRADKARDAYENYQAALATGNLPYIRNSLLALVAAQEDVAEYWIELGKIQVQLGALSDAYYAFTRAHELDRSNPQVLQVLTQLALRGGDLDRAEEHAEQLSLLAPDDPAVKMTQAYVALRRGNIAESGRIADDLLQSRPFDPAVKVLKARLLLRTGAGDAAVAMLEQQVSEQPSDVVSLNALIGILDRRDEVAKAATYGRKYVASNPDDLGVAALTIGAALRAGNPEVARQVSLRVLSDRLRVAEVASVLDPWLRYGPNGGFVAEAARLGGKAPAAQKPAFATFLNEAGAPDSAAALVQDLARLPVTAENDEANAALAMSQGLRGNTADALRRFDAILALDANNAAALKGRIRLLLRNRQAGAARLDAQRLVAVNPADAEAHILLAHVQSALGDQAQAERVLWNAFHQLSADRNIYEALRVFVARTGGPDGVRRLDQEFGDQRDAKLTREFI